jgi:NADH-quinone oxidoreductase subunit A
MALTANHSVVAAHPYAPVLVLILFAIGMVAVILVLTHVIGPKRHGPMKDSIYEAGMPIIGDARRRFNVKFYIVAMLFLLFDVEVVFLWPWAPLFHEAAVSPQKSALVAAGFDKSFLLTEMVIFMAILLIGYIYAWRKGVFRWT